MALALNVNIQCVCGEERVSGTLSGAPRVPDGGFQSELRHGLAHPLLRTIRPASFDRVADIFNFFLRLRVVQPLPIIGPARGPATG